MMLQLRIIKNKWSWGDAYSVTILSNEYYLIPKLLKISGLYSERWIF